jgi:hypothetical protein
MANHWYQQDGTSLHQVKALNGELRNTTLRDARKLNLVPSVMTILSIIEKPGLIKWQVDQGILSALTLARKQKELDDDFLKRLYADSRQQFINAGIMGDKIHTACERYFTGKYVDPEFLPHAMAAMDVVKEHFPDIKDWVTEKSFAHPLGFGGRVDLHSPSTGITIDFKGKDFTPEDRKVLKFEQHYQLGGYQIGLGLPHNWGMNVFISRTYPGYAVGHVWDREKMQHGKDVFLAAFNLWKTMKKFEPRFEQEIICPGCDVEITIYNVGGYRTFCRRCVSVMPLFPNDGQGHAIVEGCRYPDFRWD